MDHMDFSAQAPYGQMFGFAQRPSPAVQYPNDQFSVYPGYNGMQYLYPPHNQNVLIPERNHLGDSKTESKPRLSKEEVEKLERVFQENSKPTSSVKAQLADSLGLERPRINNWFQNRRAKAKQEKKQEEYEARRVAEQFDSESSSPIDVSSKLIETSDDRGDRPLTASSAPFPKISLSSELVGMLDVEAPSDDEDNEEGDGIKLESPMLTGEEDSNDDDVSRQDDQTSSLQSPASHGLVNSAQLMVSRDSGSSSIDRRDSLHIGSFHHLNRPHSHQSDETLEEVLTSPNCLSPLPFQPNHFSQLGNLANVTYASSGVPLLQTPSPTQGAASSHLAMESGFQMDDSHSPGNSSLQYTPPLLHGILTPADSFKSPPPPANIASRRNIQRPAALKAVSLRSRSIGNGPITGMDGCRRGDPSSPAASMRRIASAGGNLAGRVQKQSNGPRSPLVMNRNTEALLRYTARSPVGSILPPTPMTPAVMNQCMREPTVSSNCSDDETFILGTGLSGFALEPEPLKTPPSTPGLLGNYSAPGFGASQHPAGLDFLSDPSIYTPTFQNMPSYELSEGSLPPTPMYSHVMGPSHGLTNFAAPIGMNADWDPNDFSATSAHDLSHSQQIHFTQNMTPQDYSQVHEK